MNLNNVKYECTAVYQSQYPNDNKPEIAFVGRSNVGKSSLINYLVNRKALARISSIPGKTRGINFYNIDNQLYFVDLPGYGYAKVSQKEQQSWSKMINDYLNGRQVLNLIILLIDIRHLPSEMDKMMLKWIRANKLSLIVTATKADKLPKSAIPQYLGQIKDALDLSADEFILAVSSEKRFGSEELWALMNERI